MIENDYSFRPVHNILNPVNCNTNAAKNPFLLQRVEGAKFPVFQKAGVWSRAEILKFTLFVECFYQSMQQDYEIRARKIYQHLADFIGTRNMNQCRSFHQKTIVEHGSLATHITLVRASITDFTESSERQREHLELLKRKIFGDSENPIDYSVLKQSSFEKYRGQTNRLAVMESNVHRLKQSLEDNVPTGVHYKQQACQQQNSQEKSISLKFMEKIQGFGVQNKQVEEEPQQDYVNPYLKMKMKKKAELKTDLPEDLLAGQNEEKFDGEAKKDKAVEDNDWVECHQYFVRWVDKLNSILGKDGNSDKGTSFH